MNVYNVYILYYDRTTLCYTSDTYSSYSTRLTNVIWSTLEAENELLCSVAAFLNCFSVLRGNLFKVTIIRSIAGIPS